jgi:hypothetical protein
MIARTAGIGGAQDRRQQPVPDEARSRAAIYFAGRKAYRRGLRAERRRSSRFVPTTCAKRVTMTSSRFALWARRLLCAMPNSRAWSQWSQLGH